jgi:TPR repeat protein
MHGPITGEDNPIGRLLGELTDPFDLEVHRGISLEQPSRQDAPVLPLYVPREHDNELALVVRRASAGESAMAVLVGGSSTGKTRACWEALAPLRELGGWRLWHPIDPTRPDAALAGLRRVRSGTVVWLNETQEYLDAPDDGLGEKVAAGLRELLRSPECRPVLVLATLWPEHWDTLTTRTPADPHAQARELMAGRKISVPETFSGPAMAALAATAGQDERLAQAVTQAADGQITQYLAGVPALLDRYREAPPASRALIHAAMDYRRLGHGPYLPRELLADAASGYLTDNQWNALSEDWLEQALAYAARPSNGIPGPLTRTRIRPHTRQDANLTGPIRQPGPGPLYVLADYLGQYGRRMRWSVIPPEAFWLSAAQFVDDRDDLVALAGSARRRWRIRCAAQLYQRAARAGSAIALRGLAQVNADRGDLAEAEHYYLEAAEAGDAKALLEFGSLEEEEGNYTEAERYYTQAVGAGEAKEALLKLGDLKKRTDDLPAAESYYRQAADAGNNIGLQNLSAMRIQAGDLEEGKRLAAQARRGPMRFRLRTLAEVQERMGGKAEAEQVYRDRLASRVKGTDIAALVMLAQMREEAGDEAEAESFANQAASEGDPDGWMYLAVMRANRDDIQSAERAARIAADNGDSWALLEIARGLAEEDPRWRQILQFGLEAGGSISNPWELDNTN